MCSHFPKKFYFFVRYFQSLDTGTDPNAPDFTGNRETISFKMGTENDKLFILEVCLPCKGCYTFTTKHLKLNLSYSADSLLRVPLISHKQW